MKSKINKGLLVLTIALSIGLVAVIFMPNYRVDKAKAQTEGLSAEMQEILTMKTPRITEEDFIIPVQGQATAASTLPPLNVEWVSEDPAYKTFIVDSSKDQRFDYSIENNRVYEMIHVATVNGRGIHVKLYRGDTANAVDLIYGVIDDVEVDIHSLDDSVCIDGFLHDSRGWDEINNTPPTKCDSFSVRWDLD